jgi:hypothetical protein
VIIERQNNIGDFAQDFSSEREGQFFTHASTTSRPYIDYSRRMGLYLTLRDAKQL